MTQAGSASRSASRTRGMAMPTSAAGRQSARITRSGASAAQFLYEAAHVEREWGAPAPAPTGMAVFGEGSLMRRALDPDHKIAHWSEFDRGGHFPAMEVPDLLVSDVRAFFRRLR